ncbi:MAG: glutathione S-transferase [Yoonia sp.]
MILWGRASLVNVQKILWALEELNLSYEHRVVGGKFGGLEAPEFAALTPVGRAPVLQDEDLLFWESHSILRYLAKKTGRFGVTRHADMWMEFGSTTLQPPLIGVFW